MEVKVELSTRTEKDKVYTTISPITLHAGAIKTTIESGFESFLGKNHVKEFMPQSGGLRFPSAPCRSPADSTQRHCPVDSAERLWLVMSASDVEASKTDASKTVSELELYPGADAVVEARVKSIKMTKNGEEQSASNDAANGVEVSKLTSVFLSFQIASQPCTEWFNVLTMHKSGDTACHRLEGSKMTATDAAPQESGDTTSGAGVSIITSSMKIRLANQHSLINTRFCFFLFFNGSAENSQKSPPDWGRLE